MSRIGRMPIPIPPGVQVTIQDHTVSVRGPKGELTRTFHPDMRVEVKDGQIIVSRPSDQNIHRALHGLTRALIANMVTGVTQGFTKTLEITGVGYRAAKQGEKVVFQLGYSHPIELTPPPGVRIGTIETFTPTAANEWLSARLTVEGIDKERVGEVAAQIRKLRPAEPYKGKGIRYQGEVIRRKAGKAAGKGKAGK
ncbi:MAG TPA: 50S ribosomal protein L6 [Chloroflexota bacterium]|jgi:large subunit ribosomal protein L6|nr:50S ribosomal protein L6 [Chloroflexota bacterium]